MEHYDPKIIEFKWQEKWEKDELYKTNEDKSKPKYYILDMFPYPSGEGLHLGHPKGYTATDIFARMKRMQGYSVLHPMGWDAFGLPAENYALKTKSHPRVSNEKNIANFKRQLKSLGFSYDWDKEIDTTDPEFYKWTQWAFLQMFKKGLAYESYEPIIWCPGCKTGLAAEDLENGVCERCDSEVERKPMRQWVLKITDYAERMLQDLDKLPDWEESIKEQQKNWIGKSIGAKILFSLRYSLAKSASSLQNSATSIEVFTTRPDTLFGATYFVLAPEHSLIEEVKEKIENYSEVVKYVKKAQSKSDLERTDLAKDKSGIELKGIKAINPVNGEEIPVWVADYVLINYGTGAIMAVPAHDERDFEFAKKYDLPIKEVVAPFLRDDPRDDKKTEKRDVVTALVKNSKDNTFLCLKWNTTEWKSFPTGGIDGDDLIEAAKREVREETGYVNIKFVKQLGDSIYAEFYRPHKGSNVMANFKYLLFELENEEQVDVLQKEKEQHEAVWIKEKEVESFINVWNQKIAWKRLTHGDLAHCGEGMNINSEFLNGLETKDAKEKMFEWLEKNKLGKRAINYKLQDWVFSRQRYWGEPIPIIHCDKCGAVAVPEEELPVTLPEVEKYEPTGTGESPLAGIDEWVNTVCPKCGGPGKRETNTMPQWAGSSWYYLRYIDPNNDKVLVDKDKEKYWSPVDFYVGGAEHATRHLIYARFWHKFLYDIGVVSYDEPFTRLQHVGLILAEDGRKMSKRWGNIINPDDIVASFGADAMRVYEMFMGPFSQPCAWNTNGVVGTRRFLEKVWRVADRVVDEKIEVNDLERVLHKTIKKVGEDIEDFKFNTAISQMMIMANELENTKKIPKEIFKGFLKVLSPFAPHIAEELWSNMGEKESIFKTAWPKWDKDKIIDKNITIAVQVNGKVRDTLSLIADTTEDEVKEAALMSEKVVQWLDGKEPKKVIYVEGKLLSIVV